jgi:arylsulfatase A-like enzyme
MLTEALAALGYHTYAEVTGPLLPEMGLARGFDHYEYRAPTDYLHTAWGDHLVARLRAARYRRPWFLMLHLWELHTPRQVARECDTRDFGRDPYERAVSSLDRQLERVFAAAGDEAVIVFTGDHGEKTRAEAYQPGTAVEYTRHALDVEHAAGIAPPAIAGLAGPSVLQAFYGRCGGALRALRVRDRRPPLGFGRMARLADRLRLLRLAPFVYLHDLLALGRPLALTRMLKRRGLLDADRAAAKVSRLSRSLGGERLLEMQLRMCVNSYRVNYEEGHMIHVYDFLVRTPLVIRWPGRLPEGAVRDVMVREPDILPTLLDLLAAPDAHDGVDGRSFKPLLLGQRFEPLPAFLSVSGLPADLELRGVRTARHKHTFAPENDELPQELYDLRSDPTERRNLAAEHPDLCTELRALAESFVDSTGEPQCDPIELAPGEHEEVEARLQELGYLD